MSCALPGDLSTLQPSSPVSLRELCVWAHTEVPLTVSIAQSYMAMSLVVTGFSCRENWFLDMSPEREGGLWVDRLKCVLPLELRPHPLRLRPWGLLVPGSDVTSGDRECRGSADE